METSSKIIPRSLLGPEQSTTKVVASGKSGATLTPSKSDLVKRLNQQVSTAMPKRNLISRLSSVLPTKKGILGFVKSFISSSFNFAKTHPFLVVSLSTCGFVLGAQTDKESVLDMMIRILHQTLDVAVDAAGNAIDIIQDFNKAVPGIISKEIAQAADIAGGVLGPLGHLLNMPDYVCGAVNLKVIDCYTSCREGFLTGRFESEFPELDPIDILERCTTACAKIAEASQFCR